jgi:proline dehydrogenase
MLRDGLIYLSRQRQLADLVTTAPVARHLAERFVAGETVREAVDAVRVLNERGIRATLDVLGESVTAPDEARRAADDYMSLLDAIAEAGVDSNVSLKLTQMGLDVDLDLCRQNMLRVLERAGSHGNFVRIDMEDSAHTQTTLDLFDELCASHKNVGVVIQAYLYRSRKDVADLIAKGARVRLCKGAYAEPAKVAYPEKADVDRAFAELTEALLLRGHYPAIATHDERLIDHTIAFAQKRGIDRSRFEFQMLYGIRRDLQARLARSGYNVRVYVPFGREWYPYFMRRIAERPANLAFVLSNVLKG